MQAERQRHVRLCGGSRNRSRTFGLYVKLHTVALPQHARGQGSSPLAPQTRPDCSPAAVRLFVTLYLSRIALPISENPRNSSSYHLHQAVTRASAYRASRDCGGYDYPRMRAHIRSRASHQRNAYVELATRLAAQLHSWPPLQLAAQLTPQERLMPSIPLSLSLFSIYFSLMLVGLRTQKKCSTQHIKIRTFIELSIRQK